MPFIGPTFGDELRAAGLAGLPFSWDANGEICGREALTVEQNAALDAVIASHVADRIPVHSVSVERDRRIALGHVIMLSSGKTFRVQTRDDRDLRNIQGISSVAMIRQGLGDKTTITFRDEDNKSHDLSPSEAIELGLMVAAMVDSIYKYSWAIKDSDPIPTDFTNDKYWTG